MPLIDTDRRRRAGTSGRSSRARIVGIGTVAVVAWGVLAFGAVYPWAYWTLAGAAVLVGTAAYLGTARPLPEGAGAVIAALALVAVTALAQTVPLPPGLRTTLSPASEPFLRNTDIPYAAAVALQEQGSSMTAPRRPISIDPVATWRAVALLTALTVLLAGLCRHFGQAGTRGVIPAIIALGAVVAVIGIVQKATLGDHAWGGMKIYGFWAPRYKLTTPFGPYVNKNHYAGWMLLALPLAIGHLIALAEMGMARGRRGWRDRIVWLSSPEGGRLQLTAAAIGLMAAALALTKSRSGIACFAVTLLVAAAAAARRYRSRKGRLAVTGALLSLIVLPLLWVNVDLVSRFTSGGESVELRRQAWRDALEIVRDFPLTGTGLNTYGRATLVYDTAPTDLHFQEAHNDYLQLAAEGGLLVGIPALVSIACVIGGISRRLAADRNDLARYWARFGAVTGLAAMALQSVVEFSLQMPGNAALFVVLCAIALHETPHVERRREGGVAPLRA
jgi:O-antigen ligase